MTDALRADDPWDGDETARPHGLAFTQGILASDLIAKHFEPVKYIVPGYIAEGCTLLAGAPKIGKSWLALNLAVAVAAGNPAFGAVPLDFGDVLYLALEDNERRLRKRLLHMGMKAPARLNLQTNWPALDQGCLEEVEAWAHGVPKPRLVIVDVLQKVRPDAGNNQNLYDADYRALTGLQGFASRHGLAVLVLTHTRKAPSEDDPFDAVSGTRGLTGAADSVLVLKRDNGTGAQGRVTIYGRGRDIEEIETIVEFNRDNGIWKIVGNAHEIAKTDQRQAILDVLKSSTTPLNAREISDLSGKNHEAVRKTLTRMAANGEVSKPGRGLYACPIGPIDPDCPF